MIVVPVAKPVTAPVPGTTVATDGLLLLHTPVPLLASVFVVPAQALSVPVIAVGLALTVTVVTEVQPPGSP